MWVLLFILGSDSYFGKCCRRPYATIVCRWTMFAISTIFRVNTIYCNTIQHRLHRTLGEQNSFDGVPRDRAARRRPARPYRFHISHVINLLRVCYVLSPFIYTVSDMGVLVTWGYNQHSHEVEVLLCPILLDAQKK